VHALTRNRNLSEHYHNTEIPSDLTKIKAATGALGELMTTRAPPIIEQS
jgi:hypothetical protein